MAIHFEKSFGCIFNESGDIMALASYLLQMCEQAAEAHKSKGGSHSSRRSRMSSDSGQLTRSSVDAILSNSRSSSSSFVSPSSSSFSFGVL